MAVFPEEDLHVELRSSAVSDDRDQLRRLLAATGLALLIGGLLMALSVVLVGFLLVALAVSVLLVAGSIWVTRRVDLDSALRAAAASSSAGARTIRERAPRPRVREHARGLAHRTAATAAAAPRRTNAFATRAFRGYVNGMYRLRLFKVESIDRNRLAQDLNQRGARLRREGDPGQAAQQHRAALEIVRDLGDQHAEALTLNNLGLALAHTGADRAAVEYLEQAVDVLRELGDEEHEGQVIANLGIVYRRQGQGEEAAMLFHEALEKLPEASPAYRKVEEELQRAS
jgi:tetratricopeptide (TPR) repeat protein